MGPASWAVTGGPGQSSDPVTNREGGGGRGDLLMDDPRPGSEIVEGAD